jgi:hypothetical protein
LYNIAILDRAVGNSREAEKEFRDAFLYPDQMLTYHLTRLALADEKP